MFGRTVVVGVGRIHPCKRRIEAIDVVSRVRAEGLDAGLLIVGSRDIPEYLPELQAKAARESWCELRLDVSCEELVRLVS